MPDNKNPARAGYERAKYEVFRMLWLISHGYTLEDLVAAVLEYRGEADGQVDPEELFADWEFDSGFGGEIWPCFEEFQDADEPLTDFTPFQAAIERIARKL